MKLALGFSYIPEASWQDSDPEDERMEAEKRIRRFGEGVTVINSERN